MSQSNESNSQTSAESNQQGEGVDSAAQRETDRYALLPDKQMLGHGGGEPVPPTAAGTGIPPCVLSDQHHVVVDLDRTQRVALMVTPAPDDDVIDQAWEAVSTIRAILKQQPVDMKVTTQTVYVRSSADVPAFRRLFQAYYGDCLPPTNYVVQPPCGGQALAIEAWAVGGDDLELAYLSPEVVTVAYDDLRWIYVSGISPPPELVRAYDQSKFAFDRMASRLELAGASLRDVPRIWLYQGGINTDETATTGNSVERYRELNRARTDFFEAQQDAGRMLVGKDGAVRYPASTGIGMRESGLTISCMALQTRRDDVRLIPLENPLQTSSFNYAPRFSIKSPKFSRAMAIEIGDYVTTWVSGTASILNSESVHLGDVEKQTEQTIDNIRQLIGTENFSCHHVNSVGADLSDFAKVRVYVKRPEDYEKCRAICQRHFGEVPTIYALADVCRSELLVEIEGVTFSRATSSRLETG